MLEETLYLGKDKLVLGDCHVYVILSYLRTVYVNAKEQLPSKTLKLQIRGYERSMCVWWCLPFLSLISLSRHLSLQIHCGCGRGRRCFRDEDRREAVGEDFPRGRIQNDGISKYTRPPAFAYFVTHVQVVFQEELSLFHFSINYHMAYQVLGGGGGKWKTNK